ncbi:DUF3857 domain-containing protein [Flavobacterium sp. DGU11]|uniref:DUF3857 domain-containing protein n=1 Tax=Flavobacterium arundinis TaxID=3139143 RepID=A0ABU9HU22_9FLAO
MLKIILAVFLFFGLNAFAQLPTPSPPPVSLAEVAEKAHPKDSTVAAAYLYRYGKTWFELKGGYWVMVTEVYTRLKVYKKDGYSYANAQIVYYSDDRKAKGFFSEANTYNLVNGSIEKTPLKKDGEFEEEFQEDFTIKKIAMPNVKEGSVLEYKYTIRTPYFAAFSDWYFQYPIPANDVRYDVAIPIYFVYNVYSLGFVEIDESKTSIIYNDKTSVNDKQYSYKAKDVKAIKDDGYVNNIENYTSVLKHELAAVRYPDMPPQLFSTDWVTVSSKIYRNENFGRELEFSSYFEKDIDKIVKEGYTPRQKADSIYAFVRDRMAWNEDMGYLCDDGVKKAYSSKTGNVAEINLMLTAMLRYAGLDANPVLVSTRSNGVAVFPNRYAYNYVISSVTIDGNIILLDATSKYCMPDILPAHALNWNGRLIKKGGESIEVNLMPKINSRENISIMAQIDAQGVVTGKARDIYFDYIANVFREVFAKVQKDEYIGQLESANKGMVISNYKIANDKDPSKILTEEYDFTNTMLSDVMGSKIYFSPMLFFATEENPFTAETRDYPIDFTYPVQQRHMINITLPEGYKVESLPQSLSLAMEDNIGSFKYNITVNGNKIQLSSTLDINFPNIPKEYYQTLKDFFRKMLEKQNEKIVLTKA